MYWARLYFILGCMLLFRIPTTKHIQTPQHRALKSSSCMVRIHHFTQHTHFMCYGNETNCLHAHTHSLSSSLYAQYLEIVNCIYENKAMKTPGRLLYATAYDLYRFYSFRYMTGTKAISSEWEIIFVSISDNVRGNMVGKYSYKSIAALNTACLYKVCGCKIMELSKKLYWRFLLISFRSIQFWTLWSGILPAYTICSVETADVIQL